MNPGAVRAICFDLDNTLWHIEPVLARAESILADWLRSRYPRIAERFDAAQMLAMRLELSREQPHRAHDLTFLRREVLGRCASLAGYEATLADAAFAAWHAARNQVEPFAEVIPALDRLRTRFRLATLTNGNADLEVIGLAHHFDVMLNAGVLGCAKPAPQAYSALAEALTLPPAAILFVGDEPYADVVGPRAAGMQTVWVNRNDGAWPDGLAAPDARIASLDELVAFFPD